MGKSHVTVEAEIGVIQLQGKRCRGLPASLALRQTLEKARKECSLEPAGGMWPC